MSVRCQTRKSPNLFDHLVGAGEKGFQDGQPIAFAVLRLMTSSNLVGCLPEVERIASEIQKQDKHARPIHLQLVQLEASRRMSFTHCIGASA